MTKTERETKIFGKPRNDQNNHSLPEGSLSIQSGN